MSFVKQNLRLNGSTQPVHPLRTCAKCGEQRVPEGGIQMTPEKWICAICWTKRQFKRKAK